MKVPDITKKYVTSFCWEISQHNPLLVPLRPLRDKPINECFNIVEEHIASYGGEKMNGWALWEWSHVFIEAEFHCVWKSPEGEIFDLTPKPKAFDSILFLPDPEKKYRGRQVNNIRKPLNLEREILEYIKLANRHFKYMNEGHLADYYGRVPPPDKRMKKLTKKYA